MWPIDLLRRRERRAHERGDQESRGQARADTRPVLLVGEDGQHRVVRACCERALRAGVCPGTPAAKARAAFEAGAVRLLDHTPDHDAAALRALAEWARRFAPAVAADEPDGLLLDVTGCAPVFGGEADLLARARADLARLGVRARAAIAPTLAGARAIARAGPGNESIVDQASLRPALEPLPVRTLGLDASVLEEFAELGVERLGHLFALPRSALAARFGDDLLLRLDRATGQAIETIEPIRPVPPPAAELLFDGPTTNTEAIALAVRGLLEEVSGELLRMEAGVRAMTVTLLRSDIDPVELDVRLGRPSREVKHLWRLVEPKLERAHLGFGVDGVRIRTSSTGRLRHAQTERWAEGGAWSSSGADEAESERLAAELIDTLSNRLGAGRVTRAVARESHLPERAFVFVGGTHPAEPTAAITPTDRPTVLFDRPVPAEVVALTPDGPVHRVRWGGETRAVLACVGPERVAPEWWRGKRPRNGEAQRRSGAEARDYFRVQEETGRWLWLCRAHGSARWFVQGVWG